MLVVLIMWHDDLTLESGVHLQCLAIFGVLLGHDFARMEEIVPADAHPPEERGYPLVYT